MLTVQIFLSTCLYWFLAVKNMNEIRSVISEIQTLSNLILAYISTISIYNRIMLTLIPSILMTLTYFLMFIQFTYILTKSHINNSSSYKIRLSNYFIIITLIDNNRLRKILVGISLALILVFVVVMIILIVLALCQHIEIISALLVFESCIGAIVVSFLISIFILYCKFSGSPYKTEEHHKKLRYTGWVFGIWTVSFILKLIISIIGTYKFKDSILDETFGESILITLFCLFTEILPYSSALEGKFMNIFQMKHLQEEDN